MANMGSTLGFRSLDQTLTDVELDCRGQLPEWLVGDLLRTGPARFEVGKETYQHWFDGLAMLHRFSFQGGRVVYSNRYLQSTAWQEAESAGRIRRAEFATNPRRSLFQRQKPVQGPDTVDNGNVNTSRIGKYTVALTETPRTAVFDPDTLATLNSEAVRPSVPGQITTAHPQFDAVRQCQYNYFLEFGRVSKYRVCRMAAASTQPEVMTTIEVSRPAYMHSFGMSERYLILTEFPLVTNPLSFVIGNRPFIRNYHWEPERGTRFHVIDKDSGEVVKTVRAEPFFAFHHVNAFEQEGRLCVDLVAFPDASVIDDLYLDRLRSGQPVTAAGRLMRYDIDMTGESAVTSRALVDDPLELPRFNYRSHAGRPYRYLYAAGTTEGATFFDRLIRADLETGGTMHWSEPDCYPGEPVFVPAPESQKEDEGVLLSVVLDARAGRSFLLVADAASCRELGRAEVPHPIPFGFHGNFFTR